MEQARKPVQKFARSLETTNQAESASNAGSDDEITWVRGVNIGGWLLAERFITPYLFAVNTCHLEGDLCWYPGQVGAPKDAKICDPQKCRPVRPIPMVEGNADYHPRNARPFMEYPIDEFTLGQTFGSLKDPSVGRKYMERHWDTFVTKQDLIDLQKAGITHLRVPLSFWIRGTFMQDGETWIDGGWPYFVRMAKWAKEIGGLEIWADLHGAPGSENGFDNSGQYHQTGESTCEGWSEYPERVQRTVDILTDLCEAMADEDLQDVITGFGLLNEPFLDCDPDVVRNYYNQGLEIVRNILGQDTAVFVGDTFQPWKFNDGEFWRDPELYSNTYLDSHPYHVFFEKGRAFTPRQHVAYLCRHNSQDTLSCCYDDPPTNQVPSRGISRIIGEWSAAYDILPTALTPQIMQTIAVTGRASALNRTLSRPRQEFMRRFVEAQMVTYEAKDHPRVSKGWFFWNFKMEGGAFAEWDFLRGLQEGWIPNPLPEPNQASQDRFGTCYEIYNKTSDDYAAIVEEYPDPRSLDWTKYQGWDATDDFVLSDPNIPDIDWAERLGSSPNRPWYMQWLLPLLIVLAGMLFTFRRRLPSCSKRRDRATYEELK